MSNSLADLNAHLFAQLDRLDDETLTSDQINDEVKRAGALIGIADSISKNAEIGLKAAKLYAEHGNTVLPHLPQIAKQSKVEGSS
ncbi:hypothetical protein [Sulfitobacter sp.]|mgnify:CR=1 FL=1|jgi:hypothetical protein|uniref:hypothetical protein n=1 Tax=Sulfitobacter sp. TaxID=1903071 RepID=UPI0035661027